MNPIIFLDIDGVLNCQVFYEKNKQNVKAQYLKAEFYKSQLCPERIGWLNQLCIDTGAVVVISSSWRKGKTVDQLQEILNNSGATFTVKSKTPYTGYERGTEIKKWLQDNLTHYYDFDKYVIIDDDSDMLLNQAQHFFKTDAYSGLTPNTCYKIKRFLTGSYDKIIN